MKWVSADNETATRSSLHCYQSAMRGSSWNRHEGNRSLCGKGGLSDDGEIFLSIGQIKEEPLNEEGACKTCLKIYRKLTRIIIATK